MPAMTLPVFSEAEVQSVFISTANCIGMATMVCPVTYIAQRMVPAHHAARCGRCSGQLYGSCSWERVLTIPATALARTWWRAAHRCFDGAPQDIDEEGWRLLDDGARLVASAEAFEAMALKPGGHSGPGCALFTGVGLLLRPDCPDALMWCQQSSAQLVCGISTAFFIATVPVIARNSRLACQFRCRGGWPRAGHSRHHRQGVHVCSGGLRETNPDAAAEHCHHQVAGAARAAWLGTCRARSRQSAARCLVAGADPDAVVSCQQQICNWPVICLPLPLPNSCKEVQYNTCMSADQGSCNSAQL